jgi:hypothetical protein
MMLSRFFAAGAAASLLTANLFAQLPGSFTTNITVNSQTLTVNFSNHPIRSVNYAINVQQPDGSFLPFDPGPPSTYLGTIVGVPGAIACATLLTNGHFWARISFEAGDEWIYFTGPNPAAYVRGNTNYNFFSYPTTPLVTATGGAGTNIYAAEIAVDSGWNHFNACGQDLYRTVMAVENSILSGNYVYLRDAGILHRIGQVFIRADFNQDPYHSITSAGGKLGAVRDFLNTASTTHDVGAVADSIGGGVAWVGVIGTGNRYSANGYSGTQNGDFSTVWRHEAGHNWGALDYEGGTAEGVTIMNGNALARFSGPEENKMINHRNSKTGILDNLGPYSFPLPPRASMDAGQLYYPGDVLIDVLKNDHSGNGLALSLLTSNSTSLRGGSVAISIGTGPSGRDQLLYTPPTNNPTGVDKFAYRITDSAGRTGLGYVYVKVDPPVASPSPFDFAGNVPPSTDLSWTTFKPGSQYDVYFGTDLAAVTSATTNSPVFRGRQLSLTNDPGLLASAVTYYWRVDVVMTNGVLVPGTVWRFTTAPSPLEANLLVHLTFDNADINGQNNDNVVDVAYPADNFEASSATPFQPGVIGEAIALASTNSFVRSISSDIIPTSSGGTISTWMKTTNAGGGTYLVSVEGAWVVQHQSGGGILAFMDGSSSGNGTFGTGLNDGNWHHVLAANDGATTRLYLDGALSGTYAETIYNLGSLTRQVGVGANYDGTANFFTGTVDDVCIWARGLTASEADYVYTNGLAGKTVEKETILTRISFEAADGFTGYVSPNFAALGTKTDSFGAEWSGLAGDVQIWNRSDIAPSGVQCLKLGENNTDALCRVRFPGTTNGVGVVTFDYAVFSSQSDCDLSLSYSNATSGGWIEVWTTHAANSDPWWADKPWPGVSIPIFVSGDVDLLLKKVGVKGVLIDNFRVSSKTDFAPVFAGNPLTKAGASAGVAYATSIADDVYDPTPGDMFTFSKLSGPAWLNVAANGALTGTPTGSDYGANNFALRVTDATGKTGDATLTITVSVSATTLMAGSVPNSGYNRFWSWLSADNPSSPNGVGADANAAVVTRWDDVRGGLDHDLARNSGAGGGGTFRTNRVNGLPTINYTGTQNHWGAYNVAGEFQTMTNGYTIFAVARVNSHAATAYLFDGASGNGRVALRAVTGSPAKWQLQAVRTFGGAAINTTTNTANLTTSVFQVHAVQVSGTTMTHYINGALAGSGVFADGGTPLPMSGLILSCDAAVANHMECDIAEVLAYTETLSGASRTNIESYLLTKYALAALPPPASPTITPSVVGTNLHLQIASQSGYYYVVQAATNLAPPTAWSNFSTNAGTGGTMNLSVPVSPSQPQRFFRLWAY